MHTPSTIAISDWPADPGELFESVWAAEFEPRIAARRRATLEAQAEAFADCTLTLGGEPVRQLTPADWLQLDLMENPFITGGESVHHLDCAGLIWEVHAENNHTASLGNLWRRSRMLHRLGRHPLGPLAAEIAAYLDRMLLDPAAPPPPSSSPSLRPEPRTYPLSSLLIDVAALLGPTDPMSGQLLGQTPIPRLLQYQRTANEQKGIARAYTEMDSLRSKCLERVNAIMSERRAAADGK